MRTLKNIFVPLELEGPVFFEKSQADWVNQSRLLGRQVSPVSQLIDHDRPNTEKAWVPIYGRGFTSGAQRHSGTSRPLGVGVFDTPWSVLA